MSSKRDETPLLFQDPSFFASSTPEMRKAGAKILLKEIEGMEPELGVYIAQSVAAEIFSEMLSVRERTSQ